MIDPIVFHDDEEFGASRKAISFLESRGFSVGRNQAHAPRGILFGAYDIQKWRNLRPHEREALHGEVTGDMRNGPVTIQLRENAPAEAMAALLNDQR
jgi:hypothetical protein